MRNLVVIGIIVAVVVSGLVLASSLLSSTPRGDIFRGHLVNSQFVGNAEGTVQADRDCQSTDGVTYTCTAVIDQPGGTIYFHYTHNMHAQPCLAQGDRVAVSAQQNGEATVTKLS